MKAKDLKTRWQQTRQEACETIAQWRHDHPKATLAERETAIDQQLDQVRARVIEEVAQAQMQVDPAEESIRCPQCGDHMQRRGKHSCRLQTRGNQDVTLTRDALSCPACGYRFFPPR